MVLQKELDDIFTEIIVISLQLVIFSIKKTFIDMYFEKYSEQGSLLYACVRYPLGRNMYGIGERILAYGLLYRFFSCFISRFFPVNHR